MAKKCTPRVLRKVNLNGSWIFAAVPVMKNDRLDPNHVVYKGATLPVTGGTYYLDWRDEEGRHRPSIEGGLLEVYQALRAQTSVLELRSLGVPTPDAPQLRPALPPGEGELLQVVADRYKKSPPTRLRPRTVRAYKAAITRFAKWAKSVGVTHVSHVDRDLLLRWVDDDLGKTVEARTINAYVMSCRRILRDAGHKIKLKPKHLPKVVTKQRRIYRPETLELLFAECTADELDIYALYLQSGMREGEVAHFLKDGLDVDRCIVKVLEVPHFGFKPKDHEEREIRISRWLMNRLVVRRERVRKGDILMFGTKPHLVGYHDSKEGRPDNNLLIKLKAIALRAGLNCGQCMGKHRNQDVSCATYPVCSKFQLHMFRHTYATNFLRDGGDVRTLQKNLGHDKLETTMIYLHAIEAEDQGDFVEKSTVASIGMRQSAAASSQIAA